MARERVAPTRARCRALRKATVYSKATANNVRNLSLYISTAYSAKNERHLGKTLVQVNADVYDAAHPIYPYHKTIYEVIIEDTTTDDDSIHAFYSKLFGSAYTGLKKALKEYPHLKTNVISNISYIREILRHHRPCSFYKIPSKQHVPRRRLTPAYKLLRLLEKTAGYDVLPLNPDHPLPAYRSITESQSKQIQAIADPLYHAHLSAKAKKRAQHQALNKEQYQLRRAATKAHFLSLSEEGKRQWSVKKDQERQDFLTRELREATQVAYQQAFAIVFRGALPSPTPPVCGATIPGREERSNRVGITRYYSKGKGSVVRTRSTAALKEWNKLRCMNGSLGVHAGGLVRTARQAKANAFERSSGYLPRVEAGPFNVPSPLVVLGPAPH